MPWVSERALVQRLALEWQASERAPYSHAALAQDLAKHQRRLRQERREGGEEEDVVLGLYPQAPREWEYWVAGPS